MITDPQARYYGIQVTEKSLIPADHARLGHMRFENWLSQIMKQTSKPDLQPA